MVWWTKGTSFRANRSWNDDKPVFERAMVIAVSRLLHSGSPPGSFLTTLDLAHCADGNNRVVQCIACMVRACSGCTVGRQTPNRRLGVPDIHHLVYSMLLAVHRSLSASRIDVRRLIARIIRTTPAANIHHAVLCMLLAVHRRHSAVKIEARPLIARSIRATAAGDVHHTVLSMLLAVHRRLSALRIEVRPLVARLISAKLVAHIHHAVLSMLPAAHRRLSAFEVIGRLRRTGIV